MLSFKVIGITNAKVGINELIKIAKIEKLILIRIVEDLYNYSNFKQFEYTFR